MKLVQLDKIEIEASQKLPVYIIHPEFFFDKGNYIVLEEKGVFCALKIERKKIFTIALLTGVPFATDGKLDEKVFLTELCTFLRNEKICDLLNHSLHFFTCSFAPKSSYVAKIGSLKISLKESEVEIYKRFAANYRNEIRKVEAEDWSINKSISLEIYYSIYAEVQDRQNLAKYPLSFFEDLVDQKQYETLLWTIDVNKKSEGFACIIIDGSIGYYFFGGANNPTDFPGSNKLLQREIMFYLKNKGVNSYELGGYRLGEMEGTKLKGVQKFKKRFGAEIIPKNVFYTRIRPMKAWVYQNLLSLYLRLKKSNQNQQGIDYVYQKD